MGKLTSVYLTPQEDKALRAYCDRHGCTPHSVIKAGLHCILEEVANQDPDLVEGKKRPDKESAETKTKANLVALLKILKQTEKEE